MRNRRMVSEHFLIDLYKGVCYSFKKMEQRSIRIIFNFSENLHFENDSNNPVLVGRKDLSSFFAKRKKLIFSLLSIT